jgi:hypothetical protein
VPEEVEFESLRPVRLAYQPPANSTFFSEQISHQQPAISIFLSEQTSQTNMLLGSMSVGPAVYL